MLDIVIKNGEWRSRSTPGTAERDDFSAQRDTSARILQEQVEQFIALDQEIVQNGKLEIICVRIAHAAWSNKRPFRPGHSILGSRVINSSLRNIIRCECIVGHCSKATVYAR